ncbi:SMC-Scp complex subunit ScpB [Roseomonas eburnea]|uniref:SMC-Scp complex subunit ScpB n=1 Tax=Neoroseomonas eburnea TaxID=1346889 RepID=A0A9X9XD85_9PROT|nr:SMC-Scp complex subunit ScpB [Neoroseomonas eburnea]MBR0681671.1 SMC-Scp complex subunit ScpB [Neoroseomonas eburnea]
MNGRPEAAGEGPAPAPERGEGGEDTPALAPVAPVPSEALPQGEASLAAAGDDAGCRPETDEAASEHAVGPAPGDGPETAPGTEGVGDVPVASADEISPLADAPDPALLAAGVRIAEALIFASDRPVTPAVLSAVLPEGLSAAVAVAALAAACEGRGVVLAEVAGGWAFRTAPDLAQRLTKVVQAPRRLPRAAMEALSVIAYHQPCTRGEIEEIRGASLAQTTLEALLELGLIAPRGRREVPGRPTLWGTTPKFLEQFGLKALSDLPRKEELVTAETGPALPGLATAAAQVPGPADGDADSEAAEVSPAIGSEAPPVAAEPGAPADARPLAADSPPGA